MLWGGWEGNWLAYNYAHDVRLPGSSKAPVPFLMYPQAENAQGRTGQSRPGQLSNTGCGARDLVTIRTSPAVALIFLPARQRSGPAVPNASCVSTIGAGARSFFLDGRSVGDFLAGLFNGAADRLESRLTVSVLSWACFDQRNQRKQRVKQPSATALAPRPMVLPETPKSASRNVP